MVFGGVYSTLRREGAVVVGGDILIDNEGGDKEIGKVGRGLIIKEEVGERVRKSFKKGYNGWRRRQRRRRRRIESGEG